MEEKEIIDLLTAENVSLKNELELLKEGWVRVRATGADMSEGLLKAIDDLKEALLVARTALEHYAQGAQVIGYDRGQLAKNALEKLKGLK
jgi:hypothetical protein